MTKEERLRKQMERFEEMTVLERELRTDGARYIAGVDEVGRGPLAGPVYAACVVLPQAFDVLGIDDSKKLTERKREELDVLIRERALAYGIGIASNLEIDEHNILNATKLAMQRAIKSANEMLVEKAGAKIDLLMIDALRLEGVGIRQESLIKGDARSISIAAASIVAKVARDAFMREMDEQYCGYGFASNKGYGTAAHYEGIREFGITPIHRKTFLKNMSNKHTAKADDRANEGSARDNSDKENGVGNKVYAVRKGKQTGIFETWDECKAQVDGFKGAEYKSFKSMDDAWEYLGLAGDSEPDDGTVKAYVDGSYDVATGRYSCGAILLIDGREVTLAEAFSDEQSELRNVAGEIMGARRAIEYALANGIDEIKIYHDYAGIGKWGDGEWKANLDMTREYKEFVKTARARIKIEFIKVQGHSGNKYNEIADKLAKSALTNSGDL